MTKKEFNANKKYLLEECDNIFWVCEKDTFAVDLESYTKAGGDMMIYLDVCDKEHLQDIIDNFNINHEVAIWWPDGEKVSGVPFDNIKEHYEDIEEWVNWLQGICEGMPY